MELGDLKVGSLYRYTWENENFPREARGWLKLIDIKEIHGAFGSYLNFKVFDGPLKNKLLSMPVEAVEALVAKKGELYNETEWV